VDGLVLVVTEARAFWAARAIRWHNEIYVLAICSLIFLHGLHHFQQTQAVAGSMSAKQS
jgi:hypothetical protein